MFDVEHTPIDPNMTPAERAEVQKQNMYEHQIISMVGQELQKHYPGWRWWVECRLPTGLVQVRNLDLSGEFGFIIPIMNLINETDNPVLVMRAGGEILERYGQITGKRPERLNVERDFLGEAIGDTPDAKR